VALTKPLAYEVPAELADRLRPGHRVKVPLRGRQAHGFVLACGPGEVPPGVKLRPVISVDPEEVLLDSALLDLVKWISRYYVAPIGMTLETAVPRSVARPPKDSGAAAKSTLLSSSAACPGSRQSTPLVLNPAQTQVLERVSQAIEAHDKQAFLLQGVTASGKTEVYLRAAELALGMGQGVLLLVPEIALGIQMVRRVRERFGDRVAEYHSQLKASERRRAWWDAKRGRVTLIVGARSAVFVPVRNLGLIVVDEEHEPSYKQGEAPRYHGRDTALMRGRIEGAVTILGSATPSLESRANVERGKYERLLLPERIDARPTPRVTLVDLRSSVPEGESPAGLKVVGAADKEPGEPISEHLLDRLRATVAQGDQAILFLNRRGFSTAVQCRDCGYVFECPRCSVVLTYHRTDGLLRCHYCNYHLSEVEACPKCSGTSFAYGGVGTQKVEAALARHLPQARVLRMDLDSTRKRGTLSGMIGAFERGEVDVLLGTQMVAKGFDFPRVTLVGVINADREMGLPDFRGQERAFQLLTQVAGRAGRGEKAGEAIFQTYLPDHHVITAAGLQDYDAFYRREMDERSPLGYPPFRRMANLLFDGRDEAAVIRRATAEAERLTGRKALQLLGPAPMPLSRLKGQFRWHLTLLSASAGVLAQELLGVMERAEKARPRGRVRIQVDMDPVSML